MGKAIIGVLAIVCAVLVGCSSGTNSGSGGATCSIDGNYDATYGTPTGDPSCPDLSAVHATYSYIVQSDGKVTGSVPADTAPVAGNTLDLNTCKSHEVFAATKTPDPGCEASTFTLDTSFTSTGFSGTYAMAICVNPKGTVTRLACTYPITGTKK
jgi:hypothetical protein